MGVQSGMCRTALALFLAALKTVFAQTVPEIDAAVAIPAPVAIEYAPITPTGRLAWAANSSFGLRSTGVGLVNSALWTGLNVPEEYHGTWQGFGKRLAMRTATVTSANTIEAATGALWGEDPRYLPQAKGSFGSRVKYALKMSVMAYNRNGKLMPAYGREIGNVSVNFISNKWRPDSENHAGDAAVRCVWGVTARMAGNAFSEFWPDLRHALTKK